tara:strand:- start:839 stop:1339 length:501 start_codon:yes stop_codon:yes gene_type:complete
MAHSVVRCPGEATTNDHVGIIQSSEEVGHLGGVVLAVGIKLVGPVEALFGDVAKTEAKSAANAKVEGKPEAGGTGICRYLVGSVDRAVVYDHYLMSGDMGSEVGEDPREGIGLVKSWDDGSGSHGGNGIARLTYTSGALTNRRQSRGIQRLRCLGHLDRSEAGRRW